MDGFARFQEALIEVFSRQVVPTSKKETKALGGAARNYLFDPDGPKQLSRKLTGREIYLARAFEGFAEILASIERLEDIAFLLGRFPFQSIKIPRERYLQLLAECYFIEVHLLQQRLLQYIVFFERQFRRDTRLQSIQDRLKNLPYLVKTYLEPIVTVRHRHIHEARLNEIGIKRLGTLGLITRARRNRLASVLRPLYEQEYSKTKKRWKDKVLADTKVIRDFLDFYFKLLHPIVFNTKTGVFKYPSRLKF